jgi:hypothetical protein
VKATSSYQHAIELRAPLLVGFFLAGLVIHGGLQEWWITPVLESLSSGRLFVGAAVLTAFNDNALITYLAIGVCACEWLLINTKKFVIKMSQFLFYAFFINGIDIGFTCCYLTCGVEFLQSANNGSLVLIDTSVCFVLL